MGTSEVPARLTVVGIGAGGWPTVGAAGREALAAADVVVGGRRHLAMLPDGAAPDEREPWPSPLLDGLDAALQRHHGRSVVALASGDPMVSGIGSTLVRRFGTGPGAIAVRVLPAVSSVALARARMGWAAEQCETVTLVGRDVDRLRRHLAPGRRLIALTSDEHGLSAVSRLLVEEGFGAAAVTVLTELGGSGESRTDGLARDLTDSGGARLSLLCIECRGGVGRSPAPGLPDDAFEHDGQLSRRPVRAAAVSALAPRPGELLWDVGAGAGSVAVEWARAAARCTAAAIERNPRRAVSIRRNAAKLGVPDAVSVVEADAPDALPNLAERSRPDAVFIGGGATRPGLLQACWDALPTGGRLVAHAVTLETEAVLADWYARCGGELLRYAVDRAGPIGTFTGWQPARPVVQWSAVKGDPVEAPAVEAPAVEAPAVEAPAVDDAAVNDAAVKGRQQ